MGWRRFGGWKELFVGKGMKGLNGHEHCKECRNTLMLRLDGPQG